MAKGHIIFGMVVWLSMVLLPLVVFVGEASSSQVTPTMVAPQGEEAVVQVLRSDTGKVEEYSLSNYLFGVVAAEMPMSYHDEALKAQCVAAYSLYLHRGSTGENTPISDDSATDQAFITKEVALAKWGEKAEENSKRLEELIAQVLGQRVTYQGETALTVYHALSAGRTESAQTMWGKEIPYLVPVESVGDVLGEGYISQKQMTKSEFLQGLGLTNSVQEAQPLGKVSHSESGTVLSVELFGKLYTGAKIREIFSLRSANFDLEFSEEKVTFVVRGYGHGVGMSQFGANTMAQQGSDYKEILEWYYKGCTVENL